MLKNFLLFFFIMQFANAQESSKLTFSQIVDTPDQAVGAKILEKVYSKLGISVNFLVVSGKRALIQSSRGLSDGEVHRILKIGEIYSTLLRVPTPINYIEPSIFSVNKYNLKSCNDLKDLRVGIVAGVKHAELCTEGFKKTKILKHSLELIRVLNERGVDVVITARLNGEIQIEKLGYSKVKIIEPSLSRKLLYHYVHEKHKLLIPKIDKIILEMKNSGELKEIRNEAISKLKKNAKKY